MYLQQISDLEREQVQGPRVVGEESTAPERDPRQPGWMLVDREEAKVDGQWGTSGPCWNRKHELETRTMDWGCFPPVPWLSGSCSL